MPAERANEDSVARHLARRELLNDLARYRAKARGNLSFLRQKHVRCSELGESDSRFYALVDHASADSVIPRAKTNVWGSPNQSDIQINLRRMEQFVFVNLSFHS